MRRLPLLVAVACLVGTGVAAASPAPLPLRDRLIKSGDFARYRPEAGTHLFKTANAWVLSGPHTAQPSAEIARLRREGFVAVLSEFLDRGSARQSGLSWVMQLGSAASARAELKVDFAEDKANGTSFSAFSVPAIPGARAYRVSGGGSVGENIYFADGPFLYLIGQGWSSADAHPPTRAGLIAAATTLYRRVHGHPAG
jgi:hypothetical protein